MYSRFQRAKLHTEKAPNDRRIGGFVDDGWNQILDHFAVLLYIYVVARISTSTDICGQCSDGKDPTPKPRSCRCDQACTYYGDCCENAATEQSLAEQPTSKQLSYVSISLGNSFTPPGEGDAYWMIASCPGSVASHRRRHREKLHRRRHRPSRDRPHYWFGVS